LNRRDSALLYAVVVLAAVFVGALTRPGQALAVVGLAAVVGVVLREMLGAHFRGVERVQRARHRAVHIRIQAPAVVTSERELADVIRRQMPRGGLR